MEALTPEESKLLRQMLEHELNLWYDIRSSDLALNNGMERLDQQRIDRLLSIWQKNGL